MSPESQRIAIASVVTEGTLNRRDPISDLNAMHDALRTLNRDQRNTYINELLEIVRDELADTETEEDPVAEDFAWCCATPEQCAEAFLKTINKWEESK